MCNWRGCAVDRTASPAESVCWITRTSLHRLVWRLCSNAAEARPAICQWLQACVMAGESLDSTWRLLRATHEATLLNNTRLNLAASYPSYPLHPAGGSIPKTPAHTNTLCDTHLPLYPRTHTRTQLHRHHGARSEEAGASGAGLKKGPIYRGSSRRAASRGRDDTAP